MTGKGALAAGLLLSTATGCWEPWEEIVDEPDRAVDADLVGRWSDGAYLGVEFVEDGAFALFQSDGEPRYGEYGARSGVMHWSAFEVDGETYKFAEQKTYSYAVADQGLALRAYLPSDDGNTWRMTWGYGTWSDIREPQMEPTVSSFWTIYETVIALEEGGTFRRTETAVSIENTAIIDGSQSVMTGTYEVDESGERFDFFGDDDSYVYLQRYTRDALYSPNDVPLQRVD